MATIKNYTNAAEMQAYWLDSIAPNYFDIEDVNKYRVGIFGYVNEVISNATADTFNAINIARREFYPVSAENPQSFYKMAALQKISLPVTTAPTVKAILLIPQADIISNSVFNNGIYTCVIDNCLTIIADNIPFLLDYPVVIVSKQKGTTWAHTIHYDTTLTNDLSTANDKYIMNKVFYNEGVNYVLMQVTLRQLELYSTSELVTKDSALDTITMNFPFTGHLANFDVFYTENPGVTKAIQLTKILKGQSMPTTPFCQYKMLDDNNIQLIFPKNSYFTPILNSEIELRVYTSLGPEGEFDTFSGSLSCTSTSEDYPYNANMAITGKTNGSCSGGIVKPTTEEYRSLVLNAYATNNTITTTNDLQIYFDSLSTSVLNRTLFRKKRDDPAARIFGAYCLLKDASKNVVPTNTLNIDLQISDFDIYYEASGRAIMKPGNLFEYQPNVNGINYSIKKVSNLTLNDNLDIYDDNSRFLFTNPFLIAITLNPNLVGYYYNSISTVKAVNYTYVNDATLIQFIGSSLAITRNSILGENYYKFSINISASTDIDNKLIVTIPLEEDPDYYIRATQSGKVLSYKYEADHIVCRVKYADNTVAMIPISNYTTLADGVYTNITGYTMQFAVYESFVMGDILAIKKVSDLGKIRICLDLKGILFVEGKYIPMYIDSYNAEADGYTATGYISTDDVVSSNLSIVIDHGIYNNDGTEDTDLNINMTDLQPAISIFYKNTDTNPTHDYSNFIYYKNYTMTNTYEVDTADLLTLIKPIDFIRTTMIYTEGEVPSTIYMTLKEVPLAKANWTKDSTNFNYLTQSIYSNYEKLMAAYKLLEHGFGIDMKFFNTYGKSKFYKVGNSTASSILNFINCSFKFGINISTLTSQDVFLDKFRSYVKEYIETINSVEGNGLPIYILNMTTDIKNNFPEIGYMEYYGFNTYGYDAQKIEPLAKSELTAAEQIAYIPEFINIYSSKINGVVIPKIEVKFLNTLES